ncbi:c-type cytochrome [Ideonella azotifigens]|uniref:C-type cytochrome n=1 Tax=Ideonella azotifigens TaxID=513160 RepID=A0ABN1K000_9BURK|nr:c-type cytochrome [Ideonella azotifigens]MCD2342620.1 c-type cytochrome [Ideonella azotifigens]
MSPSRRFTVFPLLLALLPAVASAVGDAEHGRQLYQARCTACHSVAYNGVGPAHQGVFGRAPGSAPGFAYSPALSALKATGGVWTEATLDRWLSDPERFAPGQRMGVSVPEAQDRADLIAYLKTLSAH